MGNLSSSSTHTQNVYEVASFTDASKTYTVDISKNTCTCPAWRYHRKGIPTCKHLDKVRPPPDQTTSLVRYRKKKTKCTRFHVISAHLPKCSLVDFLYSQKYDGVRIRFRLSDKKAITRKDGMEIDISCLLPNITNNKEDLEFDAELIFSGENPEKQNGHDLVMKELTNNRVHTLSLKFFDIIDTVRTFQDRQTILQTYQGMHPLHHPSEHYLTHLLTPTLHQSVQLHPVTPLYRPPRSHVIHGKQNLPQLSPLLCPTRTMQPEVLLVFHHPMVTETAHSLFSRHLRGFPPPSHHLQLLHTTPHPHPPAHPHPAPVQVPLTP